MSRTDGWVAPDPVEVSMSRCSVQRFCLYSLRSNYKRRQSTNLYQARKYRQRKRFAGGRASWCGTSLSEFGSMGVGVGLYFKFLVRDTHGYRGATQLSLEEKLHLHCNIPRQSLFVLLAETWLLYLSCYVTSHNPVPPRDEGW